ncbi:MAG: hypothetical protein HY736_15350 [Verrucomicrobia bacterium]|nr:hypothetical protein [Verrucomicrobiota bacterium]
MRNTDGRNSRAVKPRRELEVKLESVKSELVRWVFRCILGQTAVLLGAACFFGSRVR